MARPRTRLTNEQKTSVAQRLAMYETPDQVAEAVRNDFGVPITQQSIEGHHSERYAGRRLTRKWRVLFDHTRVRFLKRLEENPAANKVVRIQRVACMSAAAEARNNIPLAAALLGQIAKEMGGLFTNQRQITGRDERLIEFRDFSDMTDEAVDAHLAQLLAGEGEEVKWR